MSQSGYTPILSYSSATASAVPLAANLSQGELAVNTADGKLFYKDSAGVVQTMASKATGSIGGSTTQVQFNNAGVLGGSASLTWSGTVLTSSGFAGPLNGTVGATTANTGAFTTLSATGNVTLGDATTDTVTVNGYMGVGGAASASRGIYVTSSALTGANQAGIWSAVVGSSGGTNSISALYALPSTADAVFTASSVRGLTIGTGTRGASSTATEWNGIYVADQTQGTSNYGINLQVSSGANKWGIYSDGTAQNYLRGNVGIGTSSPAQLLDVSASVGASIQLTSTKTGASANDVLGNIYFYGSDASGAGVGVKSSIVATVQGAAGSASDLRFSTATGSINNVEVMRIDNLGNVGIGTSSPAVKLDVAGNATVQNGVLTVGKDTVYDAFINTPESMYFNVDSDANSTGNRFVWGTDRAGNTGGTEWMRLDSSGNLGLGVTPSAYGSTYKAYQAGVYAAFVGDNNNGRVEILNNAYASANNVFNYTDTNSAGRYSMQLGAHAWYTAPSGTAGNPITFTQAMTLDASGQRMLGITTPWGVETISKTVDNGSAVATNISAFGGSVSILHNQDDGAGGNKNGLFFAHAGSPGIMSGVASTKFAGSWRTSLDFYVNNITGGNTGDIQLAGRFDPDGNLLVGTTSGSTHIIQKSNASSTVLSIINSSATSPSGTVFNFSAAAPNNGTQTFFTTNDTGGYRGGWLSNGGVQNYQSNDSNLSDRREKTNFLPAKSYLDVICSIPVQTFNYVDQNMEEDGGLTLGVVAQDVQAVAPELVMESNWGTKDEPKMRLSIYQTDLQYALMKCIQEQQALIQDLTTRLAALEAK